jgi:hypothetical protein
MDISGFWIGFLVRTVIACILFLLLQWRWFDWDGIAREARDRERLIRQQLAEAIAAAAKKANANDYGSINQVPVEEKP